MKNKIIITHELEDDKSAMWYVFNVIKEGKVSGKNDTYCYVSNFRNGVRVFADKTKSGTHTFFVDKEELNDENIE